MAVKIRGSPSDSPDGGSPGAREIPHVPQIPSAGCDLRKLVYSAWADVQSEQRQQYSTGHIIYYNPVQWEQISLIHILFRITTKHDYYSFTDCMLLPQSPRQITIRARSMLDMSRHSDGVTSPGVVSVPPVSVCRWPQLNNFIPTRNLLHNPSPLKRI